MLCFVPGPVAGTVKRKLRLQMVQIIGRIIRSSKRRLSESRGKPRRQMMSGVGRSTGRHLMNIKRNTEGLK